LRGPAALQPPSGSRPPPPAWYRARPMAEDDAELVRRIADSGEVAREAERRLCRRYGQRAFLYGLRHLREADQARELAQSVLLAVLLAVRNRRGGAAQAPAALPARALPRHGP